MQGQHWHLRYVLGVVAAAVAVYVFVFGAFEFPFGGPANTSRNGEQHTQQSDPRDAEPLVEPLAIDPAHLLAVSAYLDPEDHHGEGRAHAHPHGNEVCASGCAASNHPTPLLPQADYKQLIVDYASQPMTEDSPALEALLYYGRQTEMYLDRVGAEALDDRRLAFLRRELNRTHAFVSFRVVDDAGLIRVYLPPTRVALDIRHEFTMDTHDLQPLVTSGTVKRVGLYHLWQRI